MPTRSPDPPVGQVNKSHQATFAVDLSQHNGSQGHLSSVSWQMQQHSMWKRLTTVPMLTVISSSVTFTPAVGP